MKEKINETHPRIKNRSPKEQARRDEVAKILTETKEKGGFTMNSKMFWELIFNYQTKISHHPDYYEYHKNNEEHKNPPLEKNRKFFEVFDEIGGQEKAKIVFVTNRWGMWWFSWIKITDKNNITHSIPTPVFLETIKNKSFEYSIFDENGYDKTDIYSSQSFIDALEKNYPIKVVDCYENIGFDIENILTKEKTILPKSDQELYEQMNQIKKVKVIEKKYETNWDNKKISKYTPIFEQYGETELLIKNYEMGLFMADDDTLIFGPCWDSQYDKLWSYAIPSSLAKPITREFLCWRYNFFEDSMSFLENHHNRGLCEEGTKKFLKKWLYHLSGLGKPYKNLEEFEETYKELEKRYEEKIKK